MKLTYYAIFDYAKDGINVSFPDVPNAFTCGFTKRHAKKMAKEVLSLTFHGTPLSDIPIAKAKKSDFSFSEKNFECIRISVHMKVRNKILFGWQVIEYSKGNIHPE